MLRRARGVAPKRWSNRPCSGRLIPKESRFLCENADFSIDMRDSRGLALASRSKGGCSGWLLHRLNFTKSSNSLCFIIGKQRKTRRKMGGCSAGKWGEQGELLWGVAPQGCCLSSKHSRGCSDVCKRNSSSFSSSSVPPSYCLVLVVVVVVLVVL